MDALRKLMKSITTRFLFGILLLSISLPSIGRCSINVSFSTSAPTNIQDDVIATINANYNASVTVTPFFPNNRNVVIYKKLPSSTDPKLITLDSISNKLVAISTNTYVDAWALGATAERTQNVNFLGGNIGFCSEPNHFNLEVIDPLTCANVLGYAANYLMLKDSGVVVVPNIIK